MPNHDSIEILESRIAFDEMDWAIKFGALQLAVSQGEEVWWSDDSKTQYKLTAKNEIFLDDEEIINPGPWLLYITDVSKPKGTTRQFYDSKCFVIDEADQTINVFDIQGSQLINARQATFQDISLLDTALVHLNTFLKA